MDKLFFDLRPTHNPHRWYLPVDPSICVGPPGAAFMFGGVGMASAVAALERTTGRPLICATAQYLGYARPPSVVDIDVWTPVEGKYNTQANAKVHIDDKEIITVNAALGSRQPVLAALDRPPGCAAARGPDVRALARRGQGLHPHGGARCEGPPRRGPGAMRKPTAAAWGPPCAATMRSTPHAGDHGRFRAAGISAALGKNAGGNGLGSPRIRHVVPTDWALRHPHRRRARRVRARGDVPVEPGR